jgi:FAD/FMN-containing dehydrogenase
VLRHAPGARAPFNARHEWMVLIELTSPREADLRATLETFLAEGVEKGLVRDAVIAESEAQAASLWQLREAMSEAQKPEGGSIKHDVSLPIARMAAFIDEASAAVRVACPGIRPVPFGHIGDGNVHFNLSQPEGADKAAFLARWEELSRIVHDIVAKHEGSISAEHGVGQMKREEIRRYKQPAEIAMMRAVKKALDPDNIFNPGKVV